jgi:hypothetical protein
MIAEKVNLDILGSILTANRRSLENRTAACTGEALHCRIPESQVGQRPYHSSIMLTTPIAAEVQLPTMSESPIVQFSLFQQNELLCFNNIASLQSIVVDTTD